MNFKQICESALPIIQETGSFIEQEKNKISRSDIEDKGTHNFVTYVDKQAEQMLVKGLSALLPEAGFITEEETVHQDKRVYRWVIDPLDGTTNFIHKCPPFAVSVALMEGEKTVAGIVYEICLKECFYSWKNGPALLNGSEIRVSKTSQLRNTFIATGFPYYAFDRLEPFMKTLEFFFRYSPGVRRLGSAATDLAYVACGRFDAFYEYNLNPWDVAAGAFIVEQAGGRASDFSAGENYIFGKEIIATNGFVHDEFLQAVKQFMVS